MEAVKIVSVNNAEHYNWGQQSDGWHLLKSDDLGVIEERMSPGSFEQLHYHEKAQQVFYILSGKASFLIADVAVSLNPGESVHIPAFTRHQISNKTDTDLRFIVISTPKSHGDRINI